MIDLNYLVLGQLENNTYILKDEDSHEIAVIDPSVDSNELFSYIDENGKNLKYILLTHGHFDHIGGVCELVKRYNAQVCISKLELDLLNNPSLNGAFAHDLNINEIKVDIELSDNDVLKLGENEIKFISTPGHTAGSGCFIINEWLFTGDTLFCQSIGRTDFETSSMSDMKNSLKKLRDLDGDFVVFPGHDVFSKLSTERMYNPYMK
ncbi:MAG: MBL fold metallo-hydrolase [Ruminococcus sp.]|nr:MBL fold metallo-hydrolase [Ruminococcus sp.]